MQERIKIVIVGGGTAGWMTAAALSHVVTDRVCDVTLVESESIGTVGVGEATIPAIKEFNDKLGIIEPDMMQKTGATFKLGIEFEGWKVPGETYMHPFGAYGKSLQGMDFHQYWLKVRQQGSAQPLEHYSYSIQAARHGRFAFPASDASAIASTYSYAYHFDAGLYANYLKEMSVAKGVQRIEGRVAQVLGKDAGEGIDTIVLESGQQITADYFIDCSGFRSLLLGQQLGVGFESWAHWLQCDRAVTAPSAPMQNLPPYTRSMAKVAGWQWRIPLQHRTGNGYVYSSQYLSDDEAVHSLYADMPSAPVTDAALLRFEAGRRKVNWKANCIAVGLSGGFLEPLESTSIYLIQVSIQQLLKLFPGKVPSPALTDEFNRRINLEYERIRDFLILHYAANERRGMPFWDNCRTMEIPDSLTEKIELYSSRGYIDQYKYGLFSPASWLAVLMGQVGQASTYERVCDNHPVARLTDKVESISSSIESSVMGLGDHTEFVNDYCKSTLSERAHG
ncbi:tryptophan halogenase family protein [Gilvimarinus sp. DA14]|uniref:tryptophan halogenase family protein n=1 Tax=Gilvimarinus sp. DA14 TaxID=2956798 RepID=UPI0020B88789|nr:tryptophan halogenase family protein [Gilvimarinus sp. DA14]UTF58710.1 tryptophan 7-halogenase [Gilvimarinus sp. DA14]